MCARRSRRRPAQDNDGVRLALYFQREAPHVKSAYGLLADAALWQVVKTVFGFPDEMANADIDSQAKAVLKRLDIADLSDPTKLDRLITRFSAAWDADQRRHHRPGLVAVHPGTAAERRPRPGHDPQQPEARRLVVRGDEYVCRNFRAGRDGAPPRGDRQQHRQRQHGRIPRRGREVFGRNCRRSGRTRSPSLSGRGLCDPRSRDRSPTPATAWTWRSTAKAGSVCRHRPARSTRRDGRFHMTAGGDLQSVDGYRGARRRRFARSCSTPPAGRCRSARTARSARAASRSAPSGFSSSRTTPN